MILSSSGGPWLPDNQSSRVMIGSFWFFAIIITATYTGNLIAFLAVSNVKLPFETLAELAAQSKVSWGTAEGVALVMLFRVSSILYFHHTFATGDTLLRYSRFNAAECIPIHLVHRENYFLVILKRILQNSEDGDFRITRKYSPATRKHF